MTERKTVTSEEFVEMMREYEPLDLAPGGPTNRPTRMAGDPAITRRAILERDGDAKPLNMKMSYGESEDGRPCVRVEPVDEQFLAFEFVGDTHEQALGFAKDWMNRLIQGTEHVDARTHAIEAMRTRKLEL